MDPTQLILVMFTADLALDLFSSFLNLRNLSRHPEGYRTSEDHALSWRYLAHQTGLGLIAKSISRMALVAAIVLGAFGGISTLIVEALGANESPVLFGLGFAGVLGIASWVIRLPFSILHSFWLEARYGFNRSTPGTFIRDQLLGILVGTAIGAPLYAAVLWVFCSPESPGQAWFFAWAVFITVQLTLTFLAPALILPLFNRFSPIEEGALKEAILAYARKEKFELAGVSVMDGSRRSSKANAFFTGFGRLRKLVLFDTLIQKLNEREILAVLAHEVGHFRLKHIPRSIALSGVTSLAGFALAGWAIQSPWIETAFQAESPEGIPLWALPALRLNLLILAAGPIGSWLSIPTLWLSRRYEFEADRFSVQSFGDGPALANALKKMSVDHLSNLHPHPLTVWLNYTHPPVLEREARLR